MKASIITPTLRRPEFLRKLFAQYHAQDYSPKELILVVDREDYLTVEWLLANHKHQEDIFIYVTDGISRIGMKRNNGCHVASGEIIVHFDDDDTYAPDWVTKSVAALTAGNGNLTGLSSAYFQSPTQRFLYRQPANVQPYVCGATMCYYKSLYEKYPFRDISEGEDLYFCTNAIVRPHNYIDGFTANIHGGNTASHKALSAKEFRLLP